MKSSASAAYKVWFARSMIPSLVCVSHTRLACAQDVYPGLRDCVISGVCHYGETYEETAIRELNEELGLPDAMLQQDALRCKAVFRCSDASCDVWGCAFVLVLPDEAKLRLQEDEVDSAAYVPLHEVCSTHLACNPLSHCARTRLLHACNATAQSVQSTLPLRTCNNLARMQCISTTCAS